MTQGRGLIIAAPSSGAGKTTLTLGLLRALRRRGVAVRGAKSGPDYIDPRFHEAASGAPCANLDAWAMAPELIASLSAGDGLLVIEGAMGLFDGAPPDGRGATADLARLLRLPVVLMVDARSQSHSVAPLVSGFARFDPEVDIAGVILNRIGSPRHERMLRHALSPLGIPVLGALPRLEQISQPSRHLGLVQAEERADLESFLETAADFVVDHIDLDEFTRIARPLCEAISSPLPSPPAQRITIARDRAFAFAYPHLLDHWRRCGAELTLFSPLADEPIPESDLIYLPGGYPELFAGRLSSGTRFLPGLRQAAQQGTSIYGECGGYMVLGQALIDQYGKSHAMAGLLQLETSFETRRLHLGYRELVSDDGPFPGRWAGHEFHYATTLSARGTPLYEAWDAEGQSLPPMGLRNARVSGSFAHLISPWSKGVFNAAKAV